jgi:hypothetical protein
LALKLGDLYKAIHVAQWHKIGTESGIIAVRASLASSIGTRIAWNSYIHVDIHRAGLDSALYAMEGINRPVTLGIAYYGDYGHQWADTLP